MTTSKVKAKVGHVKGIVAPNQEGYLDIGELTINGKPLGQLIHQVVELNQVLQDVNARLQQHKWALKEFLHAHGYDVSSDNLKALYEQLQQVHIANPTHTHQVALLKDDFVYDVIDLDLAHILTNQQLPVDYKDGYYRVENGTLVLDEVRREEMEGLE